MTMSQCSRGDCVYQLKAMLHDHRNSSQQGSNGHHISTGIAQDVAIF